MVIYLKLDIRNGGYTYMNRRKNYVNPNKAQIGDIVEFDNKQGIVVKVLNNTVIADISNMPNYNFHVMGHERQVVHHTEYIVLSPL